MLLQLRHRITEGKWCICSVGGICGIRGLYCMWYKGIMFVRTLGRPPFPAFTSHHRSNETHIHKSSIANQQSLIFGSDPPWKLTTPELPFPPVGVGPGPIPLIIRFPRLICSVLVPTTTSEPCASRDIGVPEIVITDPGVSVCLAMRKLDAGLAV